MFKWNQQVQPSYSKVISTPMTAPNYAGCRLTLLSHEYGARTNLHLFRTLRFTKSSATHLMRRFYSTVTAIFTPIERGTVVAEYQH
jgi:hypothetical protein